MSQDKVTIQRHKRVVHLKQFSDRWEVEVAEYPANAANGSYASNVTTFTGPGAESNARDFARRARNNV
jgi:hypothetical protein